MSLLIKNLEFSYKDSPDTPVLQVKHWEIKAGETVFLCGPSGAGKSTLLNVIGGILPTPQGEITILEQRIDKLSAHQRDRFRANNIGYVFQQFNLIPYLNVIDNIRLARYLSIEKAEPAVDIEKLLVTLNIEPTRWHKRASALSIGQQQRVAIARALINQPKLLIVDEPTSSLDKKNSDDFMTLLMESVAQCRTTVIFVSHDTSLSQYFSRTESIFDINSVGGGH